MAVERAPYINYNELTSNPLLTGEGSEIPIFVGTSENTVESVSRKNIYVCKNIQEVKDAIGTTGSLYSNIEKFYKENNARLLAGQTTLSVPYIYVFDLGSHNKIDDYKKALKESKVKRDATCIAIIGSAASSSNDLKWETFSETTGSGNEQTTVTKYELTNIDEVEFSPLYVETLDSGVKTILTKGLSGIKLTESEKTQFETAFTANQTNLLITFANGINNELKEETQQGLLRIAYIGLDKQTGSETFEQYVNRISDITTAVGSTRIGFVELNEASDIGLTVARICSTPYYIEPGYDGYLSVETTQYEYFAERTPEERDALFNAGLIFNEYDYTLPEITPRICLAVSSAWGITEIADADKRVNDALIHARRNVDHQIRELFKVIAPQLKRNETSVNLLQLNTELNICLESEVDAGRIQEYEIDVEEVTMNPYCLRISGRIVPVNSTLAIEFENYVGAPYAIATDYI